MSTAPKAADKQKGKQPAAQTAPQAVQKQPAQQQGGSQENPMKNIRI
jgi:hypothetical protein